MKTCYNHKKYTMCIIGYLLGRIKRLYPEYYILEEIKTIQNQIIMLELKNDIKLKKEDYITIRESIDKDTIAFLLKYLNRELKRYSKNKLNYNYIITDYILKTIEKLDTMETTNVNSEKISDIKYFYKIGESNRYSNYSLTSVYNKLENKYYHETEYESFSIDKFLAKIEMELMKGDYSKLIYMLEFMRTEYNSSVYYYDIVCIKELLNNIPVLLKDYNLLNIKYTKDIKIYYRDILYNIVKEYYSDSNLSNSEQERQLTTFCYYLININEIINTATEDERLKSIKKIHKQLNKENIFVVLKDKFVSFFTNIIKN